MNYHGIMTGHSCEINQIILCSSQVFVCWDAATPISSQDQNHGSRWFPSTCSGADFLNRSYLYKQHDSLIRVSIRKTFAQVLQKETQNFSFFAHPFCAKKQQLAPYSAFAKLKFAQFRDFVKIKKLVTVCVS